MVYLDLDMLHFQIPPTGYVGLITQYHCGYSSRSTIEGTLTLLWQKAERLLRIQ